MTFTAPIPLLELPPSLRSAVRSGPGPRGARPFENRSQAPRRALYLFALRRELELKLAREENVVLARLIAKIRRAKA